MTFYDVCYQQVNGEYIDGWYNPTFDDSTWKGASIIDNNIKPTTHGWRVQKTVSRDAVWIGNDTVWRTEAVYTTQYFRRKIGTCYILLHDQNQGYII